MGDVVVPDDNSGQGQPLPLPVTSDHLILRRLAPGDWKDLMECLPGSEEENILRWLEADSTVRLTTPDQAFYLAVELRDAGKLIGYLTLRFADIDRLMSTFDFTFNPKYEQSEFPIEALDSLFGFCFEGIKLHRVASRCLAEEGEGCKILEKAGMRREGEFLKDTRTQTGWANSIWYALLDEEYLAQPTASG
jgi:RimJ/RimL family protein N-acetyltransferase